MHALLGEVAAKRAEVVGVLNYDSLDVFDFVRRMLLETAAQSLDSEKMEKMAAAATAQQHLRCRLGSRKLPRRHKLDRPTAQA